MTTAPVLKTLSDEEITNKITEWFGTDQFNGLFNPSRIRNFARAVLSAAQPAQDQKPLGWVTEYDMEALKKRGVSTIYQDYQVSEFGEQWEQTPLYAAAPVQPDPQAEKDAKDAARYRWLRGVNIETSEEFAVTDEFMNVIAGDELDIAMDAAIDAAMSKENGK